MNKAFLIGNLTRDPELRETSSGYPVCGFSIAIDRRFKNAAGKQETDFIDITAWRQLGELCARYLSKGRKVCVVGRIETRAYEASDGSRRKSFAVVAEEVKFLSPMQGAGQGRNLPPSAPNSWQGADSGFTEVDDDELPF